MHTFHTLSRFTAMRSPGALNETGVFSAMRRDRRTPNWLSSIETRTTRLSSLTYYPEQRLAKRLGGAGSNKEGGPNQTNFQRSQGWEQLSICIQDFLVHC